MAEVIPFPELPPDQARVRTRELPLAGGAIGLPKRTRTRMAQRRASMPRIVHVLQHGMPVEGPYQDLFGDWICRLSTRAAGRNVEVVVKMIGCRRLIIKTVIV